jgi:tRNA (guanine-N7-)-methyltransferase
VKILRKIRSYVRREGRITPGQQQALTQHWEHWGIDFSGNKIDWIKEFGRDAPLVLDIGFGNGESVVALAQAHPEWNIVAIEVYRPGIGQLLQQVVALQLTNVRVIFHDAVEVLQTAIAPDSLTRIQIFFSDPWPKKRHNKRRLIQAEFVQLMVERLQTNAEIVLATDWQDYAEQMLQVLSQQALLRNTAEHYAPREVLRPLTKFELRGQRIGHEVWDLKFSKI